MSGSHQKVTLAIDLGARYTGLFLVSHPADRVPTAADAKAMTLVMPQDTTDMTYSMTARRAARHRMRGYKRFKLARRLLALAVEQKIQTAGVSFAEDEKRRQTQALRGLLKRRGYSRLDVEVDLSALEKVDPFPVAQLEPFQDLLSGTTDLATQWENISEHFDKVSELKAALETYGDATQFKKAVKQVLDPEAQGFVKSYGDAFNTLSEAVANLIQAKKFGQRSRSEYLKEIRHDIEYDSRLKKLIGVFGGADNLWRLVGNISNLQLRAERWYFNNPDMVNADLFDPKRLQKTLARAFRYFHAKNDPSKNLPALIEEVEKAPDVIEWLCSTSPEKTIPVYEDQNNRRPPVDQTLWLSPVALTDQFGDDWTQWARKLHEHDPVLSEGLDEILQLADRRSRVPALGGEHPTDKTGYRWSYILQRALDRSKSRDDLRLRQIAARRAVPPALEVKFAGVIGSQHKAAFVEFLTRYYNEVSEAKQGIWIPRKGNLLERSDIHPPMKKNVLSTLLGNLVGGDGSLGEKLLACWKKYEKVKGNSTLRSLCQMLEEARKEQGNGFKSGFYNIYGQLEGSGGSGGMWETLAEASRHCKPKEKEEKEYWRYVQNTVAVVDYLQRNIGLTDAQAQRICNPFSLAQLYNLIETEVDGFTATTLAAHKENLWRMSGAESEKGAQCSRLPADAARPFDGVLRRALDRQAWELTKLIVQTVKTGLKAQDPSTDKQADITLLIEQNKFAFTESLRDLKKLKTKKSAGRVQTQEERLKEASRNICAYSGKPLTGQVEIDHIIPRSATLHAGTIFNSEANLICVSLDGNQNKKTTLYELSDLSPVYLQKVFGTADVTVIEAQIEETVAKLAKSGALRFFTGLRREEQDCVRHALFLPEGSPARRSVLETLGSMNKTKVNGTQAWLIKNIIAKTEEELKAFCQENHVRLIFNAFNIPNDQTGAERRNLPEVYRKEKNPQPVASHSVDAMCVYGAACAIERIRQVVGGIEYSHEPSMKIDADESEGLVTLYPKACDLLRVSSRSVFDKTQTFEKNVFNETIYAENFIPLIQCGNDVFAGFEIPSKKVVDGAATNTAGAVKVTGDGMALLQLLTPYFEDKATEAAGGSRIFRINKAKAYALLRKVALNDCSGNKDELAAADAVDALAYVTVREPLSQLMKNKAAEKPDNFKIAVKLTPKEADWSIAGSLLLPSYHDLVCACRVAGAMSAQDGSHETQQERARKLQHHRVRREKSLPVKAKPAGSWVRVYRKSVDGSNPVQVLCVPTRYVGYKKETGAGNPEWDAPVTFRAFLNSTVITCGARYLPYEHVMPMSEKRVVFSNEDHTVEMVLGSDSRRTIFWTMPFEPFAKVLCRGAVDKDGDLCWLHFVDKVKLEKGQWEELLQEFPLADEERKAIRTICGKPRDGVFSIARMGSAKITISYKQESSTKAMQRAFDAGKSLENGTK